jgi:short-subunit dehydrogenase
VASGWSSHACWRRQDILVLVSQSAHRLAPVARELRETDGVHVRSHPRDLADPSAAVSLWEQLATDGLAVDVLVNSAGVGLHGAFSEQNPDAIDRMVALNVGTLTALTRLALPRMLSQGSGRIVNVASLAAYQPGGPQQAVYYATKSFVLSFSRGLARELRGSGVTVTALCPGPTKTSFDTVTGAGDSILYRKTRLMSAAVVARAGYRGMMRGSGVVIPGILTKLLAFAGELPPRRIALEVNRLLLRSASRSS